MTKVLTFKLMGDGPEYEAICKGEGDVHRQNLMTVSCERLIDPAGSAEGVEILRRSKPRMSNALGFAVQKFRKETPFKDIDVELSKEIGEKILSEHKKNPDRKYKIVFATEEALF